jgi:hypothetical protein
MEAFIVSAATEVGDKMTPIMMFCYAPVDAHLMQYKPVPGMSQPWHTASPSEPQVQATHCAHTNKGAD